MPHDSRDISAYLPNVSSRHRSRPPSYNTATRDDYARSPRLRSDEGGVSSRRVVYKPPYVQTTSDRSSATDRESYRIRAPPQERHSPTMEDDRMRITSRGVEEMDARAIAAVTRETREYPHAPRPPRHRSSPTTGSNSCLSSTYMDDTNTRTLSSLDSTPNFYSAPPQSSAPHFQAQTRHRHRQPSDNYHSTHPRLLPTPTRPSRTFSYDLEPIYRDDSLFSLPGIEEEDPYLRDSAGNLQYTYAPGTFGEVHPLQLPLTYLESYAMENRQEPSSSRSRGFLYDHRHDYNNFARWDPLKEHRPVEEQYTWSNPSHDELPDVEDESYSWSDLSHDELTDEDKTRFPRRRDESPLRRRRGNERLSTMYEDDGTDERSGQTEIEVKTAGGTVVKVKKAGRRRDGGYH